MKRFASGSNDVRLNVSASVNKDCVDVKNILDELQVYIAHIVCII